MQKRESGVDTQQIPARIRYFLGLVPQPPTCWGIKLRKALRLLAILSGAGSKNIHLSVPILGESHQVDVGVIVAQAEAEDDTNRNPKEDTR